MGGMIKQWRTIHDFSASMYRYDGATVLLCTIVNFPVVSGLRIYEGLWFPKTC